MQKLNLTQTLTQKLSPQQIQFIKLLQVPTMELAARIEEELEANPVLEEGREEDDQDEINAGDDTSSDIDDKDEFDDDFDDIGDPVEEINLDEYINNDDISGYKMYGDGPATEDDKEIPIPMMSSLTDALMAQLGYLNLSDKEHAIGEQIIGSIDNDGYVRRELEAMVNDLAFLQNIETSEEEVEQVLKRIQTFEPPGIAARDLQECLYLQLQKKDRKDSLVVVAIKVVMLCFEEFKKKHYIKIQKKLNITEEQLRGAVNMIIKLNPKPGGYTNTFVKSQYLTPDFLLKEVNGKLEVALNSKNAPELKISRSYADMLDTYDKSNKKDKKIKQTVSFVKQKLDAAKWFIDAIKQRQETLLKTMRSIVNYQSEFFYTGDESKLKPMILKDIANEINMDISTVSRVANSKSIQTDFGLFPLKFFFSESISTDSGEDVSSKEVKYILKTIIEGEDKRKPLSDDKLEKMLNDKGYNIARRTVAKYREQLNIPVARLRKEI
ncbi:RNA polymerase factor sigma-54 [Flexithrix dorotheae]|uniref:RNA polymerase factor sigma-54 n=1 Tax=Flexithrix dorotheae TaxID=70993 RepID=UPI0003713584|nr:RNA polymerase factor sigma-54 [Flexithrix dorotheae]